MKPWFLLIGLLLAPVAFAQMVEKAGVQRPAGITLYQVELAIRPTAGLHSVSSSASPTRTNQSGHKRHKMRKKGLRFCDFCAFCGQVFSLKKLNEALQSFTADFTDGHGWIGLIRDNPRDPWAKNSVHVAW